MSDTIRLERHYDATAAELWELLATRDGLASWLMPNDFEPIIGHRFTFTDTPRPPLYDGLVHCTVLDIDPPRMLRLQWVGGPVDTVVTLTVTDVNPGCIRLGLEQSGFSRGLTSWIARLALDLGWRKLLRRNLERELSSATGRQSTT